MRRSGLVVGAILSLATAASAQADRPCPEILVELMTGETRLTCECSAQATQKGLVWGVDTYTTDSNICRAALHAGIVTRSGGPVTVVAEAGQTSYRGSSRNGVRSAAYGEWGWSFRFLRESTASRPAGPVAAAPPRETATPTPVPSAPKELATREPPPGERPAALVSNAPGARVALVIGNGGYTGRLPALPNAPNDARDIAEALGSLGFEVTLAVDASRSVMEDKLATFSRAARRSDVAVAFYAGHGLQYQGVNYLAPIDAVLDDETDLRRRFVKVQDLIEELQTAKGARILILDACRDSDAVRQLASIVPKSRSAGARRGLAAEKAEGILIAFATQPDRTAADGQGRNSPFTQALLKHLPTHGQEVRTMLTRVRSDVLRATGGTQRPEVSDSLDGEFAFR